MVLGKNKGHRYEDGIFEILMKQDLVYEGTEHRGMAGKEDAMICHRGQPYKLEIKDGLEADYGQKKFKWSKEDGWTWSEDDPVTKLYTDLGALSFVQHRNMVPIKYRIENDKLTFDDAQKDSDMFEYRKFYIKPDVLWRYYAIKDVHYIQVGDGWGFYHLDEDVAGIGTEQFVCNLILRFRRKFHNRHKRIRNKNGRISRISRIIDTPWDYSFMAVIKPRGKPEKRSKYNLEKSKDQDFPSIKP